MKTKYLFVFSQGIIDESTLFVDVYIGRGVQDQRDMAFFQSLADSSQNFYFKQYDLRVTEFVRQIDASLAAETNDARCRALRCSMSAGKLRRLIKSGLYLDWAQTFYKATRGLRRIALSANSAYFCAVHRTDMTLAMPLTL